MIRRDGEDDPSLVVDQPGLVPGYLHLLEDYFQSTNDLLWDHLPALPQEYLLVVWVQIIFHWS